MAGSDSFLIFIRSSRDFNFALLASFHDDISSIKKKAEEQYLALFPQDGRIIAQAIKIMRKGIVYSLPDNIPVRCLFDGAKGICSLFMDAVTVTPDSAETRMHVSDLCQNSTHGAKVLSLDTAVVGVLSREGVENLMGGGIQISNTRQSQVSGDPSRGRDLIKGSLNQGGNTSCTSEAPKRKFPGGSTYKDPVVEEMIPGVGVLGEFAEGNTKQKKSKDPSSDEVPPSSEGESPKTGVKMHNRSAAPENETAGVHLMSSSLGTWNPDAASADMVVLDAAPEGNGSYNEKENSMALEKEARKEVGEKFDLSKVMVPDELRCGRNSGPGWRCSKKAKPDSKYCKRHCRRSTSSKKKRPKSTRDTHLMGGGVHISNGEVDNLKKMLKERDQMISGLHAAEFASRVGPSLPVDSGTSRTLRSGTKRTHESVSRAQPSASQTVSRQQLSRSQGRASVLNAETPRLFSSNFKVPKLKNATITYRTKTAHPK